MSGGRIEWAPRLAVLFDLDSTMADTRNRRHLVPSGPVRDDTSAWEEYSAACSSDEPIPAIQQLWALTAAARLGRVILSGRNDSARPQTEAWLRDHYIGDWDDLVLRPDGENGLTDWKARAVRDLENRYDFALAVDDWPPGAEVTEALGIPTLVVANAWNSEAVSHMLGELRA